MKRIYIAGPMTGLPNLNFPAFHAAAAELRALGHVAINPAEINADMTMPWIECMQRDLPELMTCTGIHLLAGWENSRGAKIEYYLADVFGYEVTLASGAPDPQSLGRLLPPQAPVPAAPMECWSVDEENFNCTSLAELLDCNNDLAPGSIVRVGEAVHPTASALCDVDDVLDTMRDRACDIAGEYADSYPDVDNEAKAELAAILANWIDKHCPPTFYTVANVTARTLLAEDFQAVAEVQS